jgi:hypothetical protein
VYFIVVVALMLVLPVISIVIEHGRGHDVALLALTGKWFTFWSVGVRLAIAGLRQITDPRFTAHTILGLKGHEAFLLVRELGFANVAIGTIGVCSVVVPSWVTPAALAGAIFLGLAGANHTMQKHRGAKENAAMVSDLFVAAVLIVYCVSRAVP